MKRFVRDQLVEMIATISDAVKHIKRSDTNTAAILLADCGDAFTAIADALVAELSDKRYLEYEKLINEILVHLEHAAAVHSRGEPVSAPAAELIKHIDTLGKELENESEVKLEIVFLPYNASMWDCLESIWKAASADPDCECYVMPIPYYERNPDRSLGKRHYDIDRFPDYVPVSDYREYDFDLRKPDVIYIHNPYDDSNLVTCVESAFYSRYLIKYTNMLVYVPYFISAGTMPEHFARLPAVSNAHRVIVQSEEIAEIYRKFNNPEKIAVLGSPKVDMVVEMSKNPPEPPEEWKKIIRGRKPVMFNSTLTSFLQYNEKFLEKIRYVISCFEKRRDDLVLIWRPHPLSEETTRSMRPQLMREYYTLVEEYLANKTGVYDDTPDFHTAMAISDAYIGGGSSLDYLFGVTGKPVLMQSTDITRDLTDDELGVLWFYGMAVDGDEAWFAAGNFNGLYKMDLTTGQTQYVCGIPYCPKNGIHLFSDMEKLGDRLFLVPYNADCIMEYSITDGKWKRIEPEQNGFQNKYVSIVRHSNKLFFIPYTNNDIVEYDAVSDQYKHHTDWYAQVKDSLIGKSAIFGYGSASFGKYIYLPLIHSNRVVRFDTVSGRVKFFEVGSGGGFYSIAGGGDTIWLLSSKKAEVIRWNPQNNKTDIFCNFPELTISIPDSTPFYKLLALDSSIMIFPNTANTIVKLDDEGNTNSFTAIPAYDNTNMCYFPYSGANCICANETQQYVFVLPSYRSPLYKIDKTTGEVSEIEIKYSREQAATLAAMPISNPPHPASRMFLDFLFSERECFNGQSRYLDYITSHGSQIEAQTNSFKTLFTNLDGTVGKETHEYIKRQFT